MASTTATTLATPAGIQNSQRQCCGGTYHMPMKVKPASSAGKSLFATSRPRLIMKPKIPAKVPRCFSLNQELLILIKPGEPKDCTSPFNPQSTAKSHSIPQNEAAP